MSSLPEYPLSAVVPNMNTSTPGERASQELRNFPSGNTVGVVNDIAVVRTDIEVGTQRTTRASSALIEDSQVLSIIQRFYDINSPGFQLSSVSLTQMPGLTHEERVIVSEYLLRNIQ